MQPPPFPECYVVFVVATEVRWRNTRRYWWLMRWDEAYETLADAAGAVEEYFHDEGYDLTEDAVRVLRVFPDGSTELATGEVLKMIRNGDGPMSNEAVAERNAQYFRDLNAEWRAGAAE